MTCVAYLCFQLLGQIPGWRVLPVQNTSILPALLEATHRTGIQWIAGFVIERVFDGAPRPQWKVVPCGHKHPLVITWALRS